jgi:hypothetical protein
MFSGVGCPGMRGDPAVTPTMETMMARKNGGDTTELEADEREQEEAAPQLGKIPEEKPFLALVNKLARAEKEMNETKGEMGSAVDTAIERHNVHKDALRQVRKYFGKKTPAQAAEFKNHFDAYWDYLKLAKPGDDLFAEKKPGKRSRKAKGGGDAQPEGSTPEGGNVTRLSRGGVIRGGEVIPADQAFKEVTGAGA